MHVEWRALFKSRVADLRHWCTVDRRVDADTTALHARDSGRAGHWLTGHATRRCAGLVIEGCRTVPLVLLCRR